MVTGTEAGRISGISPDFQVLLFDVTGYFFSRIGCQGHFLNTYLIVVVLARLCESNSE